MTLDGRTEFIDTTVEGAPFGLLLAPLRGKKVLHIPRKEPAQLVEAPGEPPFPLWQRLQVHGTIKNEGGLEARMQFEFRGDEEASLRQAFRRLPEANWKILAKTLAILAGLTGDVVDMQLTALEAIAEPLRLEFRISQPKYLNRFTRSA